MIFSEGCQFENLFRNLQNSSAHYIKTNNLKVYIMKKYLSLLFMAMVTIVSCQKFDDSEIWDKLNNHESRLAYLEEVCKNMNADIVNLQAIVTALETNDYIISASPLVTGDGYTLLFKSGKSVVIYDGKDGSNGVNGITPVISVKQDTDGAYYWTVNGEWLLVDGNKVRASATDGMNGENGENGVNGIDGITPKFKIENDYWYISYDNGETWDKLGRATGNNGLNGEDGDSLFNSVSIEDGFVVFVLNDGESTIIRIPLQKNTLLEVSLKKAGTLRSIVSSEDARVTTKLKITGKINNNDMKFIQHFTSLTELDLSECVFYGTDEANGYIFYLNPYRQELVNRTLYKVWLPSLKHEGLPSACYSHCVNLEYIVVPANGDNDNSYSWAFDYNDINMSFCPMLETLEYSEGVINIPSDIPMQYSNKGVTSYHNSNSKYNSVILPSTTKVVQANFLRHDLKNTSNKWYYDMYDFVVTCKAEVPPTVEYVDGRVYTYTNCTLYVPYDSTELYEEHSFWGQFTVLPIE